MRRESARSDLARAKESKPAAEPRWPRQSSAAKQAPEPDRPPQEGSAHRLAAQIGIQRSLQEDYFRLRTAQLVRGARWPTPAFRQWLRAALLRLSSDHRALSEPGRGCNAPPNFWDRVAGRTRKTPPRSHRGPVERKARPGCYKRRPWDDQRRLPEVPSSVQ